MKLPLWLALIGLVLTTIALIKSSDAVEHPLLIKAAAVRCFEPHPCARMNCTRRIA